MKKITAILSFVLVLFISHSSLVWAEQMPWWRSATPSATATKEGQLKNRIKVENLTGTVSAVGSNTLTIDGKVVTVSNLTKFIRRFGGSSTFSEISVGDKVSVVGNAKIIRDWSIQKRKGAFVGTIQVMTGTGFTLQSLNRGVQTVTVSALTKYLDRKEQTINFSNLVAGQKIRVKGLWDSKLNTVTEVSQIKDYSLPASSSAKLRPNL